MHLADFFRRHALADVPGVVAISGGPDSVALAHLLRTLVHECVLPRLILGHVNHQLRRDESDADESFVQILSDRWRDARVTCRTVRIDVAAMTAAHGGNLESIARRERYRWLSQLAHAEGAGWIATGHSADDQAETVLFRLLRGSGVLGLGAMPETRTLDNGVLLVRPLLHLRRQALLDYLHDQQIPYRVDSSNQDPRFTRNRIRLDLLPTLQRDYNPAIIDVLCRLADQAREIHAEWAGQARQLQADAELARAGNILVFSADRLRQASPNLLREMFRLIWQREGWPRGDMDFGRWNRLVEIVLGSRSAWDFPGKIYVRRVGGVIQVHGSSSALASRDGSP